MDLYSRWGKLSKTLSSWVQRAHQRCARGYANNHIIRVRKGDRGAGGVGGKGRRRVRALRESEVWIFIQQSEKSAHDHRVEARRRTLQKPLARSIQRQRRLIRTLRGQHIEDIRHRQNARAQRNLLTFEPRWIAAAIPGLVMIQHRLYVKGMHIAANQDTRADNRVPLHLTAFLV